MPRRRPTHALASELDRKLLDILKNGRQTLDQQSGQIVTVSPSAADLRAAVARVRDIEASAEHRPQSPVQRELRKAAVIKFNGRKIPPVDTERDDAATA